jgi:repressor LexA
MKPPLTRRQRDVYDFLVSRQDAFDRPPTLDELCQALGLSSRGSLHKHIQALIAAGLLEPMSGLQRGIRLAAGADDAQQSVPLLGYVAAGKPLEALADPETIEVPRFLRPSGACYVLQVRGDSMVEDGILDGDRVIVEQRSHARNGEVVVALIDGQEATLKRIEQRRGKVILHPANAALRPMEFEPGRVTIQGVVTGLMRSLR